jgi:hypothetical protein
MSIFRVVGGTEAGDQEAPAVWDDPADGARRVLRSALYSDIADVVVVARQRDGQLILWASCHGETALGLMERARPIMAASANYEETPPERSA